MNHKTKLKWENLKTFKSCEKKFLKVKNLNQHKRNSCNISQLQKN